MIVTLAVAFALCVGGVVTLVNADVIMARSMREGSRWIIPQKRRLLVIRAAGGFYAVVGLLLAYGAVSSGR